MLKGVKHGIGIFIGLGISTAFAFAISGTIKTWASGETLTAADLNQTVQSLKTAVESASQVYTDNMTLNTGQSTRYKSIGGFGNTTIESDNEIPLPRSGTVRNVRAQLNTANACGFPVTVVLRKNQVDTNITFTVANGATMALTLSPNSVSYVQNDVLTWRIYASGTCTGTSNSIAMTYDF